MCANGPPVRVLHPTESSTNPPLLNMPQNGGRRGSTSLFNQSALRGPGDMLPKPRGASQEHVRAVAGASRRALSRRRRLHSHSTHTRRTARRTRLGRRQCRSCATAARARAAAVAARGGLGAWQAAPPPRERAPGNAEPQGDDEQRQRAARVAVAAAALAGVRALVRAAGNARLAADVQPKPTSPAAVGRELAQQRERAWERGRVLEARALGSRPIRHGKAKSIIYSVP